MGRPSRTPKARTINIAVKMPKALVDELDKLVLKDYFTSRTDAVREAIRRLVVEYKKMECENLSKMMVGGR